MQFSIQLCPLAFHLNITIINISTPNIAPISWAAPKIYYPLVHAQLASVQGNQQQNHHPSPHPAKKKYLASFNNYEKACNKKKLLASFNNHEEACNMHLDSCHLLCRTYVRCHTCMVYDIVRATHYIVLYIVCAMSYVRYTGYRRTTSYVRHCMYVLCRTCTYECLTRTT